VRALVLFTVLSCVACDGRLPTEPETRLSSSVQAETHEQVEPLFRLEAPVRIRAGQTVTARIDARWAYPLGVSFHSSDNSTATITGKIDPGLSYAIVQITGHRNGSVSAMASVANFGRPPGTHTVEGTIVVIPRDAKRRAVGH
jgi:hypothetical protein